MVTYPLNEIDYDAADAELFHCTRNSGIYAGTDFQPTVTGADNIVTIGAGIGWIRNSKFSGKVIAEKVSTSVNMGVADASLPRIDVVCARFDKNANQTTIVAKSGVPASSPVMPAISRTETLYELYFCSVYRKAGAVSITSADVTDLRLDENVCGLMADSVTSVDTKAINNQITAFINDLKDVIANIQSGTGTMMKSDYDADGNGKVDNADNADKLDGQTASYYATKTEAQTAQTTADTAKTNATNAQAAAAAAQATANNAKNTASNAQATANNAMPKTGGTFTGEVSAISTNRKGYVVRNCGVVSADGNVLISTNRLRFQRKVSS